LPGENKGFVVAYRFKVDQSVDDEVRRIAAKQLTLALEHLGAIGNLKNDAALHEARRHVKKVRALIRLVRPALGTSYRRSNRALRRVNRLLSPIADGEAVLGTLARLEQRSAADLSTAVGVLRKTLLARRSAIDRRAKSRRVLQLCSFALKTELARVSKWQLSRRGRRAVTGGLRKTVRAARRAMARTNAHPTAGNYHAWRRRVKDHWFQLRLLERRCGGELVARQRLLETLDGHLGEYHNCVLLQSVLTKEQRLGRLETAGLLRALRRYQLELRGEAARVAAEVFDQRPREFVRFVEHAWQSASQAKDATRSERSCIRAV
jgi:CHAD domain-containing protein